MYQKILDIAYNQLIRDARIYSRLSLICRVTWKREWKHLASMAGMQLEQKKVEGRKTGRRGNNTGRFASIGGFLE